MKLTMCPIQRKKQYPTKTAAIRAALSYSRKRGVALRVYYHKGCGSFHVTRKAKVDIHTEGK